MSRRFGLAVLGALLALLSSGVTAQAATTCNATLTGTYENVVVPTGAKCTLDGAHVNNNVTVRSGSATALTTRNDTQIDGNVTATQSGSVAINDTNIAGDVRLDKIGTANTENPGVAQVCGSGVDGNVTITRTTAKIFVGDEPVAPGGPSDRCVGPTTVGGDVTFSNNATEQLQIAGSTVNGSVTATNNAPGAVFPSGVEGEEDFANNSVSGDFICRGNTTSDLSTEFFDFTGTVVLGNSDCTAPTNL